MIKKSDSKWFPSLRFLFSDSLLGRYGKRFMMAACHELKRICLDI
ncbi:MAG: hypothetical protein V3V31_02235 [Methylococcales bacterium]